MKAARDLVRRLRRGGVAIAANGEQLQIEALPGSISDADKTELRALKLEILAILHEQDKALALSVTDFQRSGLAIEIWVAGVDHSLWVVPKDGDRDCLVRRHVPAGRVWTIGELEFLAGATPTMAEDFQRLARLRSSFNASVVALGRDNNEEIALA